MSARRAARDHRPPAPAVPIGAAVGDLPRVFRVLACVEVWGALTIPEGLGRDASDFFERASQLHWIAEMTIHGLSPRNVGGLGPMAWSVDGRTRAAGRLRPLVPDSIDPAAQLAEAGCTLRDLPALRAEARRLLYGSKDTAIEMGTS